MEVGLFVGGRVASPVITKLINELIEYAKDQKKMQAGLKDELARLEKALPKIEAVLKGVDQGLIREQNPPLEKWLWQLRDAADQADDVMDEIKYNYEKERAEAEKKKVNKVITNFNTFFLRAVNKDPFLKRLKKAVKAIDEVAADVGDFYMLVKDLVEDQKGMVKSAISSRETSSLMKMGTHVFGREKEKEDIIKKLLNPDCKTEKNNLALLPIIGVGGVGKTTLAQLVYKDPIIKKHFELRMWVCISNNFDVELLTKKLYESAFGKSADCDNFDVIQKKLQTELKSKRFLVVFDDAWNDNNKKGWDELIAPLTYGKSGSMIILTTRLKVVAKLIIPNVMDSINLEGLNNDHMWDILKECAFGGEDPQQHKVLVEIGRRIVGKLKGSPLAAKTVGGILCSDLNELHWTNILENELLSLEQGPDDIMPALRLTFHYLPPYLKTCFSFCSIFPPDHVFNKNDLINMWIALGMVPRRVTGTLRPEDVGSKYFDDMLSKSIFSHRDDGIIHRDDGTIHEGFCPIEDVHFVMHDLIHDLSIHVSQGECLRINTNKEVIVPHTVRHLYAHINGSCKLSISELNNLRTLILDIDKSYHPEHDSIVAEMLKGTKSLRLLIAKNLSEFPENAKLLHLRYLSLSPRAYQKSVSRLYLLETMIYNSVSRLYLLETMIYNYYRFVELPQTNAFGKLINLRHLGGPELLHSIAGIGRFTSLQELSFRVGKDSEFKICELSNMRELRSLKIHNIENVANHDEVVQANLRNKGKLNKLSLSWSSNKPNILANEDALDHLEPHSGLKELTIMYYEGTGRPPIWFRTQALSNLVFLQLYNCNFVELPCLEELPLLKCLDIYDLDAIERIIHEGSISPAVDAFPSLEWLSFTRMSTIEEWGLTKQPNKWMPCLRGLNVSHCPKLMFLPPVPICVKELHFQYLGLNALPDIWNADNNKSEILLDLAVMSIMDCGLVSLSTGLLQNPERFVALEKLEIYSCRKMINLPPGGFSKFILLKELKISDCPNIVVQEECFLPSALQKLSISSSGYLDTTLPKALESIHSLTYLYLYECANITSHPPKKVFSRWKTLERLTLKCCPVLESIESLHGLSFIEYLEVCKCPKLSREIPSPLPLKKDETEREEGTMGQPQQPSPSCIMERGKTTAQEKPLLSVDWLFIDDPKLLSIEPLRSLSAVRNLSIEDCSKLQSLPELPPCLQVLRMGYCCLELQTRCKKSGLDWPKLSQIPKVITERGYI